MEIDLNKPAFGSEADPAEEPSQSIFSDENDGVQEVTKPEGEEDNRVPYTRFKKFHERAFAAEKAAREWEAKYNEAISESSVQSNQPADDEDWKDWVELYGDSDVSKRMYERDVQRKQEMFQSVEERAIRALENKRAAEEQAIQTNLETIDDGMEDLSSYLGRDLTEKEQSSLLDIVDEYTPKDEHGNYSGALIPFDKAWEIYELKQEASNGQKRQSRNRVAALSSTQSQGQPSQAEINANYDPRDFGYWRNRFIK